MDTGKAGHWHFAYSLIQLNPSQEHFADFLIDLRQRQVDFAFQIQGIQFDQAAGKNVNEHQEAVLIPDELIVNIGNQTVDEQFFSFSRKTG